MFSRKDSVPAVRPGKSSQTGLSFIGPEVVIDGNLTTGSQLHVDGRIDGHVRCGQLVQGASGTVAGDIVADEARIAGLVEGTVNAKTLIIEASGRVTGDVTYETISIAAGAQIDGRLARRSALAGDASTMLIATPTDLPRPKGAASTTDMFPGGDKPALVVD
ncbi:polymer-forming cytoskeletal protein [Sphingosinicella sp. LHD-64]|uniref:bactofilin family protein n=1 Tax=Sphingosinicella sp. LHD-64 TaxID=3072139 RepID=UPI00280EB194|nr:polymer-forming cytoskeletal protein [Sphingosinicella sp. LHD-64]MDQ8758342.1 polymer-forming cytoskeletal protein [Sphingosinicella sp. LHD-64]